MSFLLTVPALDGEFFTALSSMLAWVLLLLLSAELCYLSPVCFPGQSATDCLQQQRQQQERQPLIVARQGQLCYYECDLRRIRLYIFFRFKAKKIPSFSLSFALSEYERRTLSRR
jgi:hypothetical protein